MTLMEMIILASQGKGGILELLAMVGIFIMMVVMILTLGKGVQAKAAAAEKANQSSVIITPVKTGDAVTAAITAAVHQYRKK